MFLDVSPMFLAAFFRGHGVLGSGWARASVRCEARGDAGVVLEVFGDFGMCFTQMPQREG